MYVQICVFSSKQCSVYKNWVANEKSCFSGTEIKTIGHCLTHQSSLGTCLFFDPLMPWLKLAPQGRHRILGSLLTRLHPQVLAACLTSTLRHPVSAAVGSSRRGAVSVPSAKIFHMTPDNSYLFTKHCNIIFKYKIWCIGRHQNTISISSLFIRRSYGCITPCHFHFIPELNFRASDI